MTAIAQSKPGPRRGGLSIGQRVALALSLTILAPICVALPVTLLGGRRLPWQFHMPWVSPHIPLTMLVLALGAAQLALPKGDRRHRLLGYAWCAVVAAVCVTGLLIQLEPGHITAIHWASSAFAVGDLILLPIVIWAARTGRRRLHRNAVMGMVAIMIQAGALAYIPQRAIGALVFGLFH